MKKNTKTGQTRSRNRFPLDSTQFLRRNFQFFFYLSLSLSLSLGLCVMAPSERRPASATRRVKSGGFFEVNRPSESTRPVRSVGESRRFVIFSLLLLLLLLLAQQHQQQQQQRQQQRQSKETASQTGPIGGGVAISTVSFISIRYNNRFNSPARRFHNSANGSRRKSSNVTRWAKIPFRGDVGGDDSFRFLSLSLSLCT